MVQRIFAVLLMLTLVAGAVPLASVRAGSVPSVQVALSNSYPGDAPQYAVTFTLNTTLHVGDSLTLTFDDGSLHTWLAVGDNALMMINRTSIKGTIIAIDKAGNTTSVPVDIPAWRAPLDFLPVASRAPAWQGLRMVQHNLLQDRTQPFCMRSQ